MVGHKMCKTTRTGKRQKKQTPGKLNVFRGSARLLGILRSIPVTEAGVELTQFPKGNKALSVKPGAQTGAIDSDSDLQGQLRDELQQAWQTFGRLDLQTDLAAKRKALGRIRDRLSKLINELEALG